MTEAQDRPAEEADSVTRDRIRAIAAETFQIDVDRIDLAMRPDDIDQWDSLNHLRLITEIERLFSLHLTMQQIQQLQSLQDFVPLVNAAKSTG
jgi:acyl carrier protein